jgi:hypothetical protein
MILLNQVPPLLFVTFFTCWSTSLVKFYGFHKYNLKIGYDFQHSDRLDFLTAMNIISLESDVSCACTNHTCTVCCEIFEPLASGYI